MSDERNTYEQASLAGQGASYEQAKAKTYGQLRDDESEDRKDDDDAQH